MANRIAEFLGFLIAWAVTFGAFFGFCVLAAWLQVKALSARMAEMQRSKRMNTGEIDDRIRGFAVAQPADRVLSPAEFAERMERLSREPHRDWAPGQRHVAADELMYALLVALGYGEGVTISREMNEPDKRQKR